MFENITVKLVDRIQMIKNKLNLRKTNRGEVCLKKLLNYNSLNSVYSDLTIRYTGT